MTRKQRAAKYENDHSFANDMRKLNESLGYTESRTKIGKYGITLYWSKHLQNWVTIPEA